MSHSKHFRKAAITFSGLFSSSVAIASDEQFELDNLPEHLIYLYTRTSTSGSAAMLDQMVSPDRKWDPGRTLRVCFFSGNRSVTTLIREVASEWNQFSSTTFDFGPKGKWYNCASPNNGAFDIRVGFGSDGYWSAVGNHAESGVDALAPTMNFKQFNMRYSESRHPFSSVVSEAVPYHKAVIRHEFGHALGLLHEISHPKLKCIDEIRWTGPGNVYEYYAKDSWDEERVNRNLGHVAQTDPNYEAGEPDLESVMLYSLPPQILKDGGNMNCSRAPNLLISKKDAEIVAKIYPPITAANRIADIGIETAKLRPLPGMLSAVEYDDVKTRIVIDLESADRYTRRNARARLSELLGKSAHDSEVKDLLAGMDRKSYRYQLGIATALAYSSKPVYVDAVTLKALKTQHLETKDKTLRANLKSAIQNVKVD